MAKVLITETVAGIISDGKGSVIPRELELLYPYELFCDYIKSEKTVILHIKPACFSAICPRNLYKNSAKTFKKR